VDLFLIAIGIFGLLFINWNGLVNQLFITMIETIILSIYAIVLGVIERCYLPQIFDYVENKSTMQTSEAMKKYDSKSKNRKL
jgi:hypothetical protein